MASDSPEPVGRFPTTGWTLVGRAGQETSEIQLRALNDLLVIYWPALRAHLVFRRHIPLHDADDYVQGFIESSVMQRKLIRRADSDRGRFRNLLLKSLNNYVNNQLVARHAQKRAPERAASLDSENAPPLAQTEETPESVFDITWARSLLNQALERMQDECMNSGREELWQVFEGRVLGPIIDGAKPLAYTDLVQRCGFQSPGQASNALVTAKRMFERILCDTVGEYAMSEAELKSELRDLQRVLAG